MTRSLRLVLDSFPNPEALDTAVSHAILRRVSEGVEPETLRLHRPGPIVAFGPLDRLSPGYAEGVAAARARGFGAVQRLAGGRAAVFHQDTIAFSWITPDPSPGLRINDRFRELAAIVAAAFRSFGVDARVGEVPGEYCPGAFTVNARGRTKIMGVGQRLLRNAAHVGGVVVVDGSVRIRDVLIPVNEALGLAWDPATVGSLRDEAPAITWIEARLAIEAAFADRFELVPGSIEAPILALAHRLLPRHVTTP